VSLERGTARRRSPFAGHGRPSVLSDCQSESSAFFGLARAPEKPRRISGLADSARAPPPCSSTRKICKPHHPRQDLHPGGAAKQSHFLFASISSRSLQTRLRRTTRPLTWVRKTEPGEGVFHLMIRQLRNLAERNSPSPEPSAFSFFFFFDPSTSGAGSLPGRRFGVPKVIHGGADLESPGGRE